MMVAYAVPWSWYVANVSHTWLYSVSGDSLGIHRVSTIGESSDSSTVFTASRAATFVAECVRVFCDPHYQAQL